MLLSEPTAKGGHIKWAWLDHWAGGISSELIRVHLNFVFVTNIVHGSSGLSSFLLQLKNYYFGNYKTLRYWNKSFLSTVAKSKGFGLCQDRDWLAGHLSSHATTSQFVKERVTKTEIFQRLSKNCIKFHCLNNWCSRSMPLLFHSRCLKPVQTSGLGTGTRFSYAQKSLKYVCHRYGDCSIAG